MQAGLGFTHGQDHHGIDVVCTALGFGIKVTHGIQLVTKEFRTERLVCSRGEDINDTATNRKLTGAFHHAAAAVTAGGKLADQFLNGIFLSHSQSENRIQQHIFRHRSLAEGFPAENLQFCAALCQIVQLPQALLFPASGNHSGIV